MKNQIHQFYCVLAVFVVTIVGLVAGAIGCGVQKSLIDAKSEQGPVVEGELWHLTTDVTYVRDHYYLVPSPNWLLGFGAEAKAIQHAAKENYPWWDCDDYAFNLVRVASQKQRNVNYGLAVGVAYGDRTREDALGFMGKTGPHALNIIRCSDGVWYLLEPQTGISAKLDEYAGFDVKRVIF